MEVVVTAGAIRRAKLQSECHHQQSNTQFLQAGCPSCCPTNSVKAVKGNHLPTLCALERLILLLPSYCFVLCIYVSSWCNEMQARITADELAKDVSAAEALISRHKENKLEIDARVKDITRFTQKGKALIAEKNFMADEVCSRQTAYF